VHFHAQSSHITRHRIELRRTRMLAAQKNGIPRMSAEMAANFQFNTKLQRVIARSQSLPTLAPGRLQHKTHGAKIIVAKNVLVLALKTDIYRSGSAYINDVRPLIIGQINPSAFYGVEYSIAVAYRIAIHRGNKIKFSRAESIGIIGYINTVKYDFYSFRHYVFCFRFKSYSTRHLLRSMQL
jgi:hypothetical protein